MAGFKCYFVWRVVNWTRQLRLKFPYSLLLTLLGREKKREKRKFIPTTVVTKNNTRRQLLQDFKHFARRMRLKYIFHGQNRKIHPFYVKSNWEPPVQPSVTLETYLEEVKQQLSEIRIARPKPNLSRKERKALNALKQNNDLNLKKADKGSTLVVLDQQNSRGPSPY